MKDRLKENFDFGVACPYKDKPHIKIDSTNQFIRQRPDKAVCLPRRTQNIKHVYVDNWPLSHIMWSEIPTFNTR